MTITRRQLYAAGECFGECATRREPGRLVCGGGDSESTQATNITDKRVAVQDGIGVSGDRNALTFQTVNNITDGGMVSRGLDTVDRTNKRAFDSIDLSTATLAGGYDKLLDTAANLWDRQEAIIGQSTQQVSEAWRSANTDGKGTIDNKTMIVLALAAAGVAGAVALSKRG